jgi:hypothetical protein
MFLTKAEVSHLQELGWKEYSNMFEDSSRTFYKQFPEVVPACKLNGKGIQVCLEYSPHGYTLAQVSLTLRAQCQDDRWVDLSCYDLNMATLFAVLDKECQRLIKAWQACNSL